MARFKRGKKIKGIAWKTFPNKPKGEPGRIRHILRRILRRILNKVAFKSQKREVKEKIRKMWDQQKSEEGDRERVRH